MDRRELLKSIGIFSLVSVAFQQRAFSLRHSAEGAEWAKELRRWSDQLLRQEISQERWQLQIGEIYQNLNFTQLLQDLDFEAVRAGMEIRNNSGNWQSVVIDGLTVHSPGRKIHTKIVGIKEARSVPPHGHENEVSAFLILDGRFRLRQYDRVALRNDSLDIRPVSDGITLPGDWNSQSELQTNVHWLITESAEAFFLSVRVEEVDGKPWGRDRIPIDPDGAESLGNGIYRARIMESDEWWSKYG
jgi:hypothetical protein